MSETNIEIHIYQQRINEIKNTKTNKMNETHIETNIDKLKIDESKMK